MSRSLYNLLTAAIDDRTPFRVKRLAWCSVIGFLVSMKMLHEFWGQGIALPAAALTFGFVTVATWALVCACEWAGVTRIRRPNGSVSYHIHAGRLVALFGGLLVVGIFSLAIYTWHAGWFEGPAPVTSRHR